MQAQIKELTKLEDLLSDELKKLDTLRHNVDRDVREKNSTATTMNRNNKEAKFFKDKLKHTNLDKLTRQLDEIPIKTLKIRREKLKELNRALGEFEGIEPTNEGLKDKIDDLQKSRLSLEYSFM